MQRACILLSVFIQSSEDHGTFMRKYDTMCVMMCLYAHWWVISSISLLGFALAMVIHFRQTNLIKYFSLSVIQSWFMKPFELCCSTHYCTDLLHCIKTHPFSHQEKNKNTQTSVHRCKKKVLASKYLAMTTIAVGCPCLLVIPQVCIARNDQLP